MRHALGVAAIAAAMTLAAPAMASTCTASWYGGGEKLARHTANGEVFRPNGITAAHRTLPFGTKVRVTHRGKSVVVRITDRGPAAWTGKCIDLSRGAAAKIGLIRRGVGRAESPHHHSLKQPSRTYGENHGPFAFLRGAEAS